MQARIYVLVPSFATRLLRLPSAAGIALALGPVWWSRCSSRWRHLIKLILARFRFSVFVIQFTF